MREQQYEVSVEYSVRVRSLFPPSPQEEVFMAGLENEYGMQAHANASGLEEYFTDDIKKRKQPS